MSEQNNADTSAIVISPTVVVQSTVVKPEAKLSSKRGHPESRTSSPSRSVSRTPGNRDSRPPETDVSAEPEPPKRIRRNPTIVAAEEKGRNKRMFGMLLTSLGKFQEDTSRSKIANKREEVERRVRESQMKESLDMERQIREERLKRTRLAEFRRTQAALNGRTAIMRQNAALLKTDTTPIIYYKPNILRKEEAETISEQVEEAEYKIRQEWDDFYVRFPKEEFIDAVNSKTQSSESVQTDGPPANADESERGYKSDEAEDDDGGSVAAAAKPMSP
ncbi:pinin/SDK/memA/ protein conserved region-domain-containing protein [Lipomyces tetrasporus]|uniref:Pinin/SDK/memA/ protein conserved region-domain-containing protein n=1 Tax=Lipomyces tetrasporus TaxID=54092 RepID=A0AAD7QVM1_9ASCO|nr:pinin/SDK/memA/ protein conserved region-domain-containing protein [Lipomyces tetrasporus]KAJ8102016.1 pinin/SDK/memA/ protein conserved region-domain-containing protein [Lipomyces tetrasporus]